MRLRLRAITTNVLIVLLSCVVLFVAMPRITKADTDITVDFSKYENGTPVADFQEKYMTFSAQLSTAGLARAYGHQLQLYSGGTTLSIVLAGPASGLQLRGDVGGPCAMQFSIQLFSGATEVNTQSYGYCDGQFIYKKSATFDKVVITLGGPANATQNLYLTSLVISFANLPVSEAGPTVVPTSTPSPAPTLGPTPEATIVVAGTEALVNNLSGKRLTLLTGPDLNQTAVDLLTTNTAVTVTFGPVALNNQNWWRVRTHHIEGWVLTAISIGGGSTPTLIPYTAKTLDQAIDQATQVLGQRGNATAYVNRATAYFSENKYDFALADLTDALNLGSSGDALYLRGLVNYAKQTYGGAVKDFTAAITLTPKDAKLYNARAQASQNSHDYNAALSDYQVALQINRRFATVFNNRGVLYTTMKNEASAYMDFAQATQIDTYYGRADLNLGIIFAYQNNPYAAIQPLSQAILVEPTLGIAYMERGLAYQVQGDRTSAMADYNHALQINPNDSGTLLNLGTLYFAMGDDDTAIATLTKAIQVTSATSCVACAYYDLGLVYYSQGNLDKAIENYSQAIKANPKFKNAYINRAQAYKDQGKAAAAQADLDSASQITGDVDPPEGYMLSD